MQVTKSCGAGVVLLAALCAFQQPFRGEIDSPATLYQQTFSSHVPATSRLTSPRTMRDGFHPIQSP